MQDIEDYVAKKRDTKHSNCCQDRAENLSAINLRSTESAEQTDYQQRKANSKQQKVRPWKIACDWKPGKEFIGKQPGERDNEADPYRPVPFSFHCALDGASPRIQRYRPIAIAAKPNPPRIFPAVSKPGPTNASGASFPEKTIIAEITTPII